MKERWRNGEKRLGSKEGTANKKERGRKRTG